MNTTLTNHRVVRYTLPVVNTTSVQSLLILLFLSVVFTAMLALNNVIFSLLIVVGFGGYGIYSITRHDYAEWFSVLCFFCGGESILRNGLPSGYMFFFFYLVGSGVIFMFIRTSRQRFKIISATGFIFLLAILHFVHVDFQELRFGLGKWGLIWIGLFFGMWICRSIALNTIFYRGIWFYMLGCLTVLFSFLLNPIYADGRFWPTFDGTGPVAAAIGLLALVIILQVNLKQWFSLKNILFGGILIGAMIALVMLGSRGTFLALGVAMIFFLFTMPGIWSKVLIAISILIMALLVYRIDQSSIGGEVLSSRIEEAIQEDTREGRRFINQAVFLGFSEDPILGKGTGSWRHYNNQYIAAVFDRRYPKDANMADAHSTPLHLLFEHGILGAGLFLLAVGVTMRRSYVLSKYARILILPLLLFSITLGVTTIHKQAPMFLPFFMVVMTLYRKPVTLSRRVD